MNRRAIRGLATLGIALGAPLGLASGAAVVATAPGGSPAALVVIFSGSLALLASSVATFLVIAAREASRPSDKPAQGLWFDPETGTGPDDVEGDHMTNRERR